MKRSQMSAVVIAAVLFGPLGAFAGGAVAGLVSCLVAMVAVTVFGAPGLVMTWIASILAAIIGAQKHNEQYDALMRRSADG